MQSCIFVALLLTFVLAQEEPETKELFGSRRKINLVNNVLHSTVRKILRPYRNKIPRTFTKNTRVYHGRTSHGSSASSSDVEGTLYSSNPIPFPTEPAVQFPAHPTSPPIPYPSNPLPTSGAGSPSYPSYPDPIPFPSDPSYPDPIPFPADPIPFPDDPIPFPSYPTFPQPPGVVPSQTPTGSLTLDETLAADERFTTLVAALAAAFDNRPTADVLNGTSPLTLFAPTNSAFAKVGNETLDGLLKDPDALSGVLQRHLVANKAVRIPDGTTTLETLDGGSLTVQRTIDDIFSEGVTVRSSQATAKIVELDIQASDGVIHAIDTVL